LPKAGEDSTFSLVVNLSSLISRGAFTLTGLFHYYQPPGCHPLGSVIPPGYERVELVTGGRGWILDREEWRAVAPGDLIWNKPGDHTIGRSDFANPYRCLAISLQTGLSEGLGLPRFSRWPALEEVEAFARETTKLFFHDRFDRGILCRYVIGQLLFRMELHHQRASESRLPLPLRSVLTHLERRYTTPCRIDDLARMADCSPAHLHALFRTHLRSSPHQWLINRRLRAAREKLESTHEPIKRIAVECGFPDTAAFTKTFRQHLGITPSRYREQARRLLPEA